MFYKYPKDTNMVGDGQGGVWLLCDTSEGGHKLFHADQQGEQMFYKFPKDTNMVGDGQGGVWLLCKTTLVDKTVGEYKLWHADKTRERLFYKYTENTNMVGDGQGGVWLLCNKVAQSPPSPSFVVESESMFANMIGLTLESDRHVGKVKIFFEEKGFGYIEDHNAHVSAKSIFMHASQLRDDDDALVPVCAHPYAIQRVTNLIWFLRRDVSFFCRIQLLVFHCRRPRLASTVGSGARRTLWWKRKQATPGSQLDSMQATSRPPWRICQRSPCIRPVSSRST
jgi:hypothetical protein